MFSPFLITLREGLEAALIIGIILAFLVKTGHRGDFRSVWMGVGAAVLTSLVAGAGFYFIAGEFTGRGEEIFEGAAMLLATGVLTWMVFWMRQQAVNIKANLHAQVESALAGGSSLGLVMLSFVIVVREGIETVLFLFTVSRVADSPVLFTAGGLLGLAIAVIIGYSIYRGSSWLNLRAFFNVTSVILIVFAAGLLAHGIHELQEAGIVPIVIEHVWDMNHIISENATVGQFLKAIIGYNGNPALIEVIAYVAFLGSTLALYFRHGRVVTRPETVPEAVA